jgi:hypothetical protein
MAKCTDKNMKTGCSQRREPREWTEKDLRRIGKKVLSQGNSNTVRIVWLMMEVAGVGYLACKAARIGNAVSQILGFVAGIAGTIALGQLVARIYALISKIKILANTPAEVVKNGRLIAILLVVAVVLEVVVFVLSQLEKLSSAAQDAVDVLNFFGQICQLVDNGENQIKEFIDDKAKDELQELLEKLGGYEMASIEVDALTLLG